MPQPANAAAPEPLSKVVNRSPWQIVWMKLRRNRSAMTALGILLVLYTMAILAGVLAPYSYDRQDKNYSFHPPMITRIHVRDATGNLRWPFVYASRLADAGANSYAEDTSEVYPLHFFARGDSYLFLWLVPSRIHLVGVDEPGRLFLFGTDQFGRDILSRILYGSRISLSVGILGIMISTSIGMLVGGVAGYYGGKIDFTLMRIVELILALPSLYLILVLRQSFGEGLSSTELYLIIILILSFVGWAAQARVIRGMVWPSRSRNTSWRPRRSVSRAFGSSSNTSSRTRCRSSS